MNGSAPAHGCLTSCISWGQSSRETQQPSCWHVTCQAADRAGAHHIALGEFGMAVKMPSPSDERRPTETPACDGRMTTAVTSPLTTTESFAASGCGPRVPNSGVAAACAAAVARGHPLAAIASTVVKAWVRMYVLRGAPLWVPCGCGDMCWGVAEPPRFCGTHDVHVHVHGGKRCAQAASLIRNPRQSVVV